ncbi:MAG: hypothetical protein FIB01_14285 [Gemmatimonadetes bacterium]|nr:hypothetical protein [Gemmatimonadota bacterium]
MFRFALLVLRRPLLIGPMLHAAWRFRARGWWRRPPFLPLPPRAYLQWRLETAFGAGGGMPEPAQVERYLRWAREAARGGARRP